MPGIRYTEAMRQQAVARALDPHTTVAQVARDIGCSTDTMHRWLRQHRRQNPKPDRQPGVAHPIVSKMPRSQSPKDTPSVVVSKMPRLQLSKDAPPAIVRKHRDTNTPSAAPPSRATFIPVNIIDSQGHSVEIVTPHGAVIRLTDASPRYIAELLNALATC